MEAEYRRQRGEFLLALEWWLRDVWMQTLGRPSTVHGPQPPDTQTERGSESLDTRHPSLATPEGLLAFPQLAGTERVAQRLSPQAARENLRIVEQLQRWLHTNVQEALALEVGLLKLQL